MWCLKKITVWSQFSVKTKKPCLPPVEAEIFQQEFPWTFARDEYQVKEKGFLYYHGAVSLPLLLEGKHTDADGLQRKTTLKPIRGLIHVLCKSRHFMSVCQHWLHNKSSCCAEQGFSQFVEWKYEFIATPVSMCMSVSLSGILILYLYRKKRWSRG